MALTLLILFLPILKRIFLAFCNNLKSRVAASRGLKPDQRQCKTDNPLVDIQDLTIRKSALVGVCPYEYSELFYFTWVIM